MEKGHSMYRSHKDLKLTDEYLKCGSMLVYVISVARESMGETYKQNMAPSPNYCMPLIKTIQG
jgi:hypothetical protein